jgi:hypothetical protein
MSVSVPNTFPPGTRFGEFDGIPITQDQDQNLIAWDVPGGRRFLNGGSATNPAPISETAFRAIVKRY